MATIRPRGVTTTSSASAGAAYEATILDVCDSGASALDAPDESVGSSRAVVLIPALEPGPELVTLVAGLIDDDIDVLVVDDGSGPRYGDVFDRCRQLGADVMHLEENGLFADEGVAVGGGVGASV
ncbi:MAG: hypothetical protein ACTIB6_14620, partial [Brachybacterium alimentarium]